MYQYFIYGLGIHSEIKLYNLTETPSKPDVLVHYGSIPEDIIEKTKRGHVSSMSQTRVWFQNDAGHFIILNGNEIMVQPLNNADEKTLASFVLGWGLSFLFQMRNASAIHCSAIEVADQAILVSGVSGAGKSTVALSLLDAGYRYLADDIIMVEPTPDMLIHPGFPLQKVCRNVAEKMNPEDLFYIDERKDKFAYYNTKDFCNEPRKLTTMISLQRHDGDTVQVEQLTGLNALNCVLNNLFLLDAYKIFGYPPAEKVRCLDLAGKLTIYKISRPKGKDTVAEIRDTIIQLLQQKKEA